MTFAMPPGLAGKTALIVEDEMLVALLIEEFLADAGCATLGPYRSVGAALSVARSRAFDLAILDVNLGGEKVYPVAEVLAERGIPFLFLSGYGDGAIPVGRTRRRVCAKPFTYEGLLTALSDVLEAIPQ